MPITIAVTPVTLVKVSIVDNAEESSCSIVMSELDKKHPMIMKQINTPNKPMLKQMRANLFMCN